MGEQPELWKAFVKLGKLLGDFCENQNSSTENFSKLKNKIALAQQKNGWFTHDNILFSLKQWSHQLTQNNLRDWLGKYDIAYSKKPKTVGIIMAGNIPLVGFHDFLCVLLTGNKALCKLSSNDDELLPLLADFLVGFDSKFEGRIAFTKERLEDFDAIIATGSNNTSRYFEYYFGKYPNLIRKNRTSVAVLSGNETKEQVERLGHDVFRYFGLGCRNVSKIYVPAEYNFDMFFEAIYAHKSIIDHHKYANNYDYNKAVYLMSEFKILDNGFLILKKDESLHSPIAALFYEHYNYLNELKTKLEQNADNLQCIVSDMGIENEVGFGNTQRPRLYDYADGVDTVEFLLKL